MYFKGVPVQRCVAALRRFAKLYTYDLCTFMYVHVYLKKIFFQSVVLVAAS